MKSSIDSVWIGPPSHYHFYINSAKSLFAMNLNFPPFFAGSVVVVVVGRSPAVLVAVPPFVFNIIEWKSVISFYFEGWKPVSYGDDSHCGSEAALNSRRPSLIKKHRELDCFIPEMISHCNGTPT